MGLVGAIGVLLLAATVVTVGALDRHRSTPAPATTVTPRLPTTTTSTVATTQPVPPLSADGSYAVGTTNLSIMEPGAPGTARRSLPTAVFYPVRGTAAAGGPDAQPERTHAPYPLLVFSQGYDLSVQAYSTLLTDWASAGFVVAAPTYPHTDPSDQRALDENDITNHPADLRYVITTLLDAAHGSGSPLSGLIDANEIGAVGHSDGADVTLAVAADACCQDPRVKAAAILSGAELASFAGRYVFSGTVPLLVTQGNADTINLPACSAQIYNAAASPKYYLDLLGAPHEPPYADPGPDQQIVAQVTTDFFDAELAGQSAALAAMSSSGNVGGRSSLTTGPGRASANRCVPGSSWLTAQPTRPLRPLPHRLVGPHPLVGGVALGMPLTPWQPGVGATVTSGGTPGSGGRSSAAPSTASAMADCPCASGWRWSPESYMGNIAVGAQAPS